MLRDTHCHIDLFNDPISQALAYEKAGIRCIATTMLPSHYQLALLHLKPFRLVHPSLGMHPLRSGEAANEIEIFRKLVNRAEYIGEIGLDFSVEGKSTKKQQVDILKGILGYLGSGKFVTVHSRNAHEELAVLLEDNFVGPVCFHYFIGGALAAVELANRGHFFSINHRMLRNRHRMILDSVPMERILVESDGPFLTNRPLEMINNIYDELSKIWNIPRDQVEDLLAVNFNNCRTHRTGIKDNGS